MKGTMLAVVVVVGLVSCFIGAEAEESTLLAYNNATNQNMTKAEWCGCIKNGTGQEDAATLKENKIECFQKVFDVYNRFRKDYSKVENFNCTAFYTEIAEISTTTPVPTTTSNTVKPNTSPVTDPVQNESTTNEDKVGSSDNPADPSTSDAPVSSSAAPSDTSTESPSVSSSSYQPISSTTNAPTEKEIDPKTEADGTNHLYWTLPLICVLLIAMLIAGFLIYRYTKKAGYLQQPAKSTVNGESTKKTTEGV